MHVTFLKQEPAFIGLVTLASSLTLDLEPQTAEQFPKKRKITQR